MKIADVFKKAAAAVFPASPAGPTTSPRDARREAAAAHAAWHAEWAERQRAYRASHAPGVRVPGPRQLGMSWPPPQDPNALTLTPKTEQDL